MSESETIEILDVLDNHYINDTENIIEEIHADLLEDWYKENDYF